MAATKPATQFSDADPHAFVDAVAHPVRRRDGLTLLELMRRATGQEPRMFGTSIVAFGTYEYRYASGRSGTGGAAAFSPRKDATVVYLADGLAAHHERLDRLGPYRAGVGCLYLKDLDDVDLGVLKEIVRASYAALTAGVFGQRAREA
ncbi:DUF1801 domain-containing protein [Xylanimonas protaetiae]|uniref:DUF1801 domain-containing protein n=1 Tax=Xylanimonas protaetiae TaxID=2509457 RepID=A0A4P6F5J4_9MICO|nr:DUF1801 domain-containing protein [Xylanimonas protaetiae]QAY71230.1 DUF1801 domain-containing protein [Xylanimonas protaetiae]